MQIIPIDNLLDNDYFDLDRSKEELSPAERTAIEETKAGLSFRFTAEDEVPIESFLRYFLTELLAAERPIFLFFSEPFPAPRSRLRTHQHLFYGETAEIGADHYFTHERELPEGQSLQIGVIRLSAENLEYALERLFFGEFVFGLIEAAERETPLSPAQLLTLFDRCVAIEEKRRLNPLRLALQLPREEDVAFRLALYGNDDQVLELLMDRAARADFVELGERFRVEGC
jgi:hypothetical protein